MVWIFSLILSVSSYALAEDIYLFGQVAKQETVMTKEWMKKHEIELMSADPSFDKTLMKFKGVPLDLVFKTFVKGHTENVVFIAQDQYVTAVKAKDLKGAIIASEINGQPLSPKIGGPYKLVFPPSAGKPANAFCWYVKSIVFGEPYKKLKLLESSGKLIKEIAIQVNDRRDKRKLAIPVPVGHRDYSAPANLTDVHAQNLESIISKAAPKAKKVILKNMIQRSKEYLIKDLSGADLVYQAASQRIEAGDGGPFIVLKSTENNNKDNILADRVTFFLYSIQVVQ